MADGVDRARQLARAEQHLQQAATLIASAHHQQNLALDALKEALKGGFKGQFKPMLKSAVSGTEHRRAHRPGNPSKLDIDLELRAFVLARIDNMTFVAIAADIATYFPKERRVGKTAIHAWWDRQGPDTVNGARAKPKSHPE